MLRAWGPISTIIIPLLLGALAADGFGDAPARPKRVLILYSHRHSLPINQQWDRGIREGLASKLRDPVVIDVEFLDFQRLENDEYRQKWLDLLGFKYQGSKPDVVIPVDDTAAALFANRRPDLFPDAAVVFCSVSEAFRQQLPVTPRMTGVSYRMDFRRTLDGARRLLPATRTVIVVCGTGDTDLAMLQAAKARLADEQEVEFVYWTGIPTEILCAQASQVPPGSVILYLTHDRDRDGKMSISPRDVVEHLSSSASVPVFGLYDTLLGAGIVGGCLAPVEEQGKRAGEVTARVLQGERPNDIPFSGTEMNRFVFDGRQLLRWGMREPDLPEGAVVQFREPTVWKQYGVHITAGATVIVLQSLLIVALLINRRKRLRAEQARSTSQQEARRLAGRLLTAQEDERKWLAREMHDDVSQRLAATAIEAGRVEQELTAADPSRAALTGLKEHLIALSDDVHRISRQLHPAILDDLGLADAIRSKCDRLADHDGLVIDFRCGRLPANLPKHLALSLYRIAQEALRNVAKHAQTKQVDLILNADLEFLYLEIRDFGCGFDPAVARSQPGLGLVSMEERIRLVGGEIAISSAPGKGVSIEVRVPLLEDAPVM